jgi:uncharacterized RDD family membrane protein YckC
VTALHEQSQGAGAPGPIAGFWRRMAALAVDLVILGVPMMLVGFSLFGWLEALGQAGRLIGFVIALLYFGLLNSYLGHGQTVGKRLLGIRVVDRAGDVLSPARSIARFLVIAIPYFLNGLWFDLDTQSADPLVSIVGVILAFIVFGGLGTIAYLFVFNRRTRQSLHDLAVGSFVVRGPAVPIPARLVVPRLHFIIAGCWLLIALIGPVIGTWIIYRSDALASARPLAELQTKIKTELGVQQVRVVIGTTTFSSVHDGTSTNSYLQITAQPGNATQNDSTLALSVAQRVLDWRSDLIANRVLIVLIEYASISASRVGAPATERPMTRRRGGRS